MTVNTTWVGPTGATLDLSNGTVVTETNWDALASDLYRLGGTDGNAKTGPYQIGSTQTYSNANNTAGLNINQAAADDEILSLKSNDVSHGVTGVTETDTYAFAKKFSATDGGLNLVGLNDTAVVGMKLQGGSVTDDTTKSLAGLASVVVEADKKSGTNLSSLGANANLCAFAVGGVGTRFILDADGDSHQDIGTAWTNFHGYDDIALLNTLSAHLTRQDDPLRSGFTKWLEQSREPLEKARIVTFNDDGHHFINWSRTHMLEIGAIIQLGERLARMEERLAALPSPRG